MNLHRYALAAILLAANPAAAEVDSETFSMRLIDAFKISGRGTILTGQIGSGGVEAGDTICVPLISGNAVATQVDGIQIAGRMVEQADTGQLAGLLVKGVERKQVKKKALINTDCLRE